MKTTSYNSGSANDFPSLSEKTWQEFSKYLSRYQWSRGDPSKSPRKTEIAHAILNKGKPGACTFHRQEGYKFVLRPMHQWAFEQAITEETRLYYVSSGKQALLYFDIDLHHTWQTEDQGEKAKGLIDSLCSYCFGKGVVFWSKSSRGANGYLKVSRQWYTEAAANAIFGRLQHALQLYLALCKNLADFEIKGRFGYMKDGEYEWAQFGKLPLHSAWDFAKMDEFSQKPTVSLSRVKVLCELLEKTIPQDVLDRHNLHKKSLGDKPIVDGFFFLVTPTMQKRLEAKYGEDWRRRHWPNGYQNEEECWLPTECYRPKRLPRTEAEALQETLKKQNPPKAPREPQPVPLVNSIPHKTPSKLNLDFSDLINEPDSFKRQQRALVRFARYLKRVPTVEEALILIHQHRLFSGSWEDNEAKRRIRVNSILHFISQTFDASKCAKGSVNVGKYDEWARKKFPNGITARSRRTLNQEGKWIEGRYRTSVDAKFVSVFMSVVEFGLLVDKNKDGSLPHKRGEQIWNALYDRGVVSVRFCARKWAVCRNEMNRLDIITITDPNYAPGKAMKWEENRYFPGLGIWKGEKKESQLDPDSYAKREERKKEEHNTWLYNTPLELGIVSPVKAPRPPPHEKGSAVSNITHQNGILERKGPRTIRTHLQRKERGTSNERQDT